MLRILFAPRSGAYYRCMENNWKERFFMLLSVVVVVVAFVWASSMFDSSTCYKVPGCTLVRDFIS
jgi:hypothetical protein